VIVLLGGIVRTDHGRGRDQDLERGVALPEGAVQPRELFGSPERLVRPVGHHVRAAVIPTLDEPELQIPAHSVGPVGDGLRVGGINNRHLFPESGDAKRIRGCVVAGGIGVVLAMIVIVLEPVRRHPGVPGTSPSTSAADAVNRACRITEVAEISPARTPWAKRISAVPA
jgi:hypothetical protein